MLMRCADEEESAMPTALSRMHSSTDVMMVSSERSSCSTLVPPETRSTIGVPVSRECSCAARRG